MNILEDLLDAGYKEKHWRNVENYVNLLNEVAKCTEKEIEKLLDECEDASYTHNMNRIINRMNHTLSQSPSKFMRCADIKPAETKGQTLHKLIADNAEITDINTELRRQVEYRHFLGLNLANFVESTFVKKPNMFNKFFGNNASKNLESVMRFTFDDVRNIYETTRLNPGDVLLINEKTANIIVHIDDDGNITIMNKDFSTATLTLEEFSAHRIRKPEDAANANGDTMRVINTDNRYLKNNLIVTDAEFDALRKNIKAMKSMLTILSI